MEHANFLAPLATKKKLKTSKLKKPSERTWEVLESYSCYSSWKVKENKKSL